MNHVPKRSPGWEPMGAEQGCRGQDAVDAHPSFAACPGVGADSAACNSKNWNTASAHMWGITLKAMDKLDKQTKTYRLR